jgi:hypothetical protein
MYICKDINYRVILNTLSLTLIYCIKPYAEKIFILVLFNETVSNLGYTASEIMNSKFELVWRGVVEICFEII